MRPARSASVGALSAFRLWARPDNVEYNVIGGNWPAGVGVDGGNNAIAGNEIGVDSSGTNVDGTIQVGISVHNSSGIQIGTNGDGINDAAERNR